MTRDDGLGVDIGCLDDLSPRFELESGLQNLAMAIARRLCTARGALWYAGNYGEDLADWVNHEVTRDVLHEVKTRVERQAMMDERVETATAAVSWNAQTETMRIRLTGKAASGPYRMVVAVDQVGARIIEGL